jgi:hypothetical protein
VRVQVCGQFSCRLNRDEARRLAAAVRSVEVVERALGGEPF